LLFTTHHILDESITLIGSKLHPDRALQFARLLLSSRVVNIVRTDDELEQAALIVYERFHDSRLSFTDCLSFAVMHALGISAAFAFDRHFERAGFQLLRKPIG
jgi:predicted nucleic acid-binding protein